MSKFPVAKEIKSALVSVAKKLVDVGIQIENWVPDFDFVAACQIYFAVATYNMVYSQPIAFDDVRKQMPFLFREATQGDRTLRNLINTAGTGLSIWLKPTLKGYFEALTSTRSPDCSNGQRTGTMGRVAVSCCDDTCIYPSC